MKNNNSELVFFSLGKSTMVLNDGTARRKAVRLDDEEDIGRSYLGSNATRSIRLYFEGQGADTSSKPLFVHVFHITSRFRSINTSARSWVMFFP